MSQNDTWQSKRVSNRYCLNIQIYKIISSSASYVLWRQNDTPQTPRMGVSVRVQPRSCRTNMPADTNVLPLILPRPKASFYDRNKQSRWRF